MANYDSNDLDWTWDGDYTIGDDGDIGDTIRDLLLSVVHEVQTVIKSEAFDWERHITLGSQLADFQGEPNTRATGNAIQERVKSKIVDAGIVQPQDLDVRVVPVHVNQVLILIRIAAFVTAGNRLAAAEPVQVDLIYDTFENGIFFLLDDNFARNAIFQE